MIVAMVSTGRQDWGILAPVVSALAQQPGLSPRLVAGGLHLRNGRRATLDGVAVEAWIGGLPENDGASAVARAAAEAARDCAAVLPAMGAGAVLVAGDRTETLAVGLAATCLRLPLIHLHGGETTRGAIDDACRHALSMLASMHAVAHADFAARLRSWGIPAQQVVVSGAPALDALLATTLPDAAELAAFLGRPLGSPLVLLTHHPATLGADPVREVGALLEGMDRALAGLPDAQVVATRANSDPGSAAINDALMARAAADRRWTLASDCGSRRWWGLMAQASALVGNSSSAILEAPCFDLTAVNVGARQEGRLRLGNVIDVSPEPTAIATAVASALALTPPGPRRPHPTAYGNGHAAERIAEAVATLVLGAKP